jgi:hypothetical protein
MGDDEELGSDDSNMVGDEEKVKLKVERRKV